MQRLQISGGGCIVPPTAYSPKGRDCASIPNVTDITCKWGQCIICHCLHSLMQSADGSSCVSKEMSMMEMGHFTKEEH